MPSKPQAHVGVSFITLGVSDLDRSRRFYESIGFTPEPKGGDSVVFFNLSGLVLALYPREELARDANTSAGEVQGIVSSLSQNVTSETEVRERIDRARAAGGRVLREPSEPTWGGLRGYFADPDGFVWEVAWNPNVDLLEDGRIRWRST